MDDSDSGLQAALDQAIAERERLNVVIGYISEKLGIAPPDGSGGGPSKRAGGGGGGDPVAGTHEGEFFGYTSTKAAKAVLEKYGKRERPLKTRVIYEAIKKGGVKISAEEALYRSLARSHAFRKVGPNLWGIASWYPATAGRDQVKKNVTDLTPNGDEVSDDEENAEVDAS